MIWRGVALVLAIAVTGCGGCDDGDCRVTTCGRICGRTIAHCTIDSFPTDVLSECNPLTQAGCAANEKCTWLLDAVMPLYVGHVGCAPDGIANPGDACTYGAPGATGYDNCRKGSVCNAGGKGVTGECAAICDPQGGQPVCDALRTCVSDEEMFRTSDSASAVAGLCERACDPLADNDFDGSGSALTRMGSACGSDPAIGCYGYPSFGTAPETEWACRRERHYELSLRHRSQCTTTTGCAAASSTIYVNSCNQGYLPLLYETTGSSTVICTALCKPKNCYAGNCGTNDEDRLGEAPHRCTPTDRVGTFDTSANGEHCRYLWSLELDQQGNFLRSPSSDTVGFCFDHSKYKYDSNNDNTPDTTYPPCASLPDGVGSGSALGAADIGCVDTTHVNLATGKARRMLGDVRPLD